MFTLKKFSHSKDKLILILSPIRQNYIIDNIFVLPGPKVIFVPVLEEFRKKIEFWDEFLEITRTLH